MSNSPQFSETVTTIGNDGFSDIVSYKSEGMSGGPIYYRLTNCCKATAKGVEFGTHVACRACYRSIDPEFGNAWIDAADLEQDTGLKVTS